MKSLTGCRQTLWLSSLILLSFVTTANAQAPLTFSKSFTQSTVGPGSVNVTSIPADFSDVVIFATNSVHLKKDTEITGDVVVNDVGINTLETGFEIGVDRNGTVQGDLKANRISIDKNAVINGDVFFNELNNKGTINGVENSPLILPVFLSPPPFQTANPRSDAPDIFVDDGETRVLEAGDYGDITVAQTGTLIFSGGRYDVRSLTSGKTSTIGFGAATDLRVLGRLDIDQNSLVGPEASSGITAADIIIYVAGADGLDSQAAKIGRDSEVSANIYSGNGTLVLGAATDATGAFLGVDVRVDKNSTVALKSFFINRPPVADPQDVFTDGADDLEIILTGSDPEGGDLTFSVDNPELGMLSNLTPVVPPMVGRCSVSGTSCQVGDCPGAETCVDLQKPAVTSAIVTYTPPGANNVADSFTFEVTDSEGAVSDPALVQINPPGDPTDDPPSLEDVVANPQTLEILKDVTVTILLTGAAPCEDECDGVGADVELTFSIASGPTSGSLANLTQGTEVPQRSATVDYTPAGGFTSPPRRHLRLHSLWGHQWGTGLRCRHGDHHHLRSDSRSAGAKYGDTG